MYKKLLLPFLVSVSLMSASLCYASEGQGMLSPSTNSSDSVFGGASSDESEPVTDTRLQALLNNLQGQLPTDNGSWSVYICDLPGESEGGLNAGSMQAASLIKLYIMGAVYEQYDSIIGQYGKEAVDSALYSMITVSDNDCANTLVNYLGSGNSSAGMQAVNSFCQTHGYTDTSMGRLLLADTSTGDNYTSAEDCADFLKEVYDEEDSDLSFSEDGLCNLLRFVNYFLLSYPSFLALVLCFDFLNYLFRNTFVMYRKIIFNNSKNVKLFLLSLMKSL